MFIGRENELNSLEKMYAKDNFEMAVVYGRRRIGKTALLNEFVKDKNYIYFSAEEVNDSLNLEKFSRIVGEKIGLNNLPTANSWQDLFKLIIERFAKEKLIIVIDEYPYVAMANKSLNSTLQHLIDYDFKDTNAFLILCGSSMSFMENEVLSEKSPLFGRRTGQIKVNPLDYYDASMFYVNYSAEDKIKLYSIVGGTPYYLSMINKDNSLEDNIKELLFAMNGYLFSEATLIMKQDFNEPANYNAILQAIASGSLTLGEIVSFTKLATSLVSKYLITLQELNYVERIIPFGANPLKGKKSQYRIVENYIAFWYRYIFSVRGEIERGLGDVYFQYAINDLSNYTSYAFENITRQYLRRLNSVNKLPFIAKSYGQWWGSGKKKDQQEIDIVVEGIDNKELIIGECKFRNSFDLYNTQELLKYRASLFEKYNTYLYLFTKKKVETEKGIVNISIDEYFEI